MVIKNRMKCAVNDIQVKDRLTYNPEIIEFHLVLSDIYGEGRKKLEKTIKYIQKQGIKVYLHHPMQIEGSYIHILDPDLKRREGYKEIAKTMVEISKKFGVKTVIHCNYVELKGIEEGYETTIELKEAIEEVLRYGREYLLWEDSAAGLFSYHNPYLIDEVILPLALPLVLDISHTFIALEGDNQKTLEVVERTSHLTEYYHVVDSMGLQHDGLELGVGLVNWQALKPYIEEKDFIFEPVLNDKNSAIEMKRSADYFNSLR